MTSPPTSAAPSVPDPVAEVTVRRTDGGILVRWPLAAGEYTLGGLRDNDLQLDERGVSGHHARLRVGEGGVIIEDLGSRYGTKRDGMLIVEPVPVTKFRPVKIGNLVIEAEPLEPWRISKLPMATLPADSRLVAPRVVPEPPPDLLRPYRSQPGWSDTRLRLLLGGSHRLDLSGLALGGLGALRGMPVSELDLSYCALITLSGLRGFSLRRLVLTGNTLRDLTPLRGQPLEELYLDETGVADLAPLAGLPLTTLKLHGAPVTNLAPLAGMPLHTLDLRDHDGIRDFRPLLACPLLTVLYAPASAELDCLRRHPALRLIALRTPASPEPGAVDGPLPVRAFWDRYGDRIRRNLD